MKHRHLILVMLAMAALLPARSAGAAEFPAPVGKVNDFAGLLAPAQREALESQLADLERATSAEVAVVTVRSLDGRPVEDYANALFGEWGIGKKGTDNGVLILVALEDRAMRIEVGYGLEGILPDGLAGAVIRETFLPRFRENDYPAGILHGTARVADIVRRNETLTADQLAALDAAAADAGRSWAVAAFVAIFVSIGAFTMGTAAGAKEVVQLLFGAVFTAGSLWLGLMGAPRTGLVLLVLLAVAVAACGVVLGRRPKWRRSIRGTGRGAGGSGWTVSSGGSSGSSSGRSGSSSFGGGRSGGGGASGRW